MRAGASGFAGGGIGARRAARRRGLGRAGVGLALAAALALGCSDGTSPSGGEAETAAAPAAGASAASGPKVTTGSGIVIETLREGEGSSPSATDTVRVHYHGTFPDGRVFDSSVQRGEPATFPLNRVIPCWTEALQTMKVGGKARITCPPEVAYGARGAGPIPPNSTLVFEVELLAIQ